MRSTSSSTPFLKGNLAQAAVNVLYGLSGVVGGIGVHDVNPAVFGAIRCWQCAGLLLIPALVGLRDNCVLCSTAVLAKRAARDWKLLALLSLFLFQGEFFYMLGLRLAGTISASLWQPSQPVFTIVIAALLGREQLTYRRVAGVALTFTGCVVMVLGAVPSGDGQRSSFLGHACLLINCLGTPLFILASKPLLARGYEPLLLTTLAFGGNSVLFAASVVLVGTAPALGELMCARDEGGECAPMWSISGGSWLAVTYISLMGTAVPFVLQMVAIKRLHASLVSAYYALQPVAATAVTYVVLTLTPPPHLGLRAARPSDLGGLLVLVGLGIVVHQDYTREVERRRAQVVATATAAVELTDEVAWGPPGGDSATPHDTGRLLPEGKASDEAKEADAEAPAADRGWPKDSAQLLSDTTASEAPPS
uniref:EamA domain-containing protein n=1 Tax=Calcidiscus leptoporus TaxID=127549 RepID=A0A7S0NX45_9EUKA|mmetsp:Transcript_35499/g.82901  ORF Transcript_35499/g.82901 Transcript_35499/m.82901 type:complete len:421 (+) Transcript_35499:113-1375(+)|eukprot:CAMPEP_0119380846 /NCGR_PEP_ID=MMETSP1334-20130426/57959_1 /TAXON_ID=127549 /ORGANISM="Calcidiscus leptoporus, Strain RCC1130" /LENGTH=420 /DNA_ID=CAMNT_0007400789 /DNA_START=108 /DNA_END=1370 /DNA_ORIENTATION=+